MLFGDNHFFVPFNAAAPTAVALVEPAHSPANGQHAGGSYKRSMCEHWCPLLLDHSMGNFPVAMNIAK